MRRQTRQLAFDGGEAGAAQPVPSEGHEACAAPSRPAALALAAGLMELVVAAENMRRALKQVKSNKGSGRVDGMTVRELEGDLRQH